MVKIPSGNFISNLEEVFNFYKQLNMRLN